MISYDSYLNRIQKLAKVKKFVHKFRFLIIGILSVIIAGTAGLLIAKGSVTTAMSLPAQIIYGDDYSPTPASAFMSPVSYEYSLEGSGEWTDKKPQKAGKYLARTVTEKSFGAKGYSDPVRFEIVPRNAEFTIGATSVVYGSVPANCNVSNLVAGQRLVTGELLFDYASYTAKKTKLDVVASTIKITDSTGDDFTSCYNITANGKELEILPRSISVQPQDCEVTYTDGAVEIKNEVNENTASQLAYGDSITVKNNITDLSGNIIPAPKKFGRYGIEVTTFKITRGDIDVTAHYNVSKLAASLYITRREITISTGSAEKPYDGNPLSAPTAEKEGLISGHNAYPVSEWLAVTNAGTAENYNEFKIEDSDGYDVTDNYIIKYNYGSLKINRRALKLKYEDKTAVYDGEWFFDFIPDIVSGKLVDGHEFRSANYYGIFNVWESGVNQATVKIWNNGEDVTGNYSLEYERGNLTLTKRDVTLTTSTPAAKVYDGTKLENYTVKYDGGLVLTHKVTAASECYLINRGSISNKFDFLITGTVGIYYEVDVNGNTKPADTYSGDVTGNYNITPVYGALTVTARPIEVTTITPQNPHIYDGTAYSDGGYTTIYYGNSKKEGLVSGDKLTVSNLAEITNVGTRENRFDLDAGDNYEIKDVHYGTLMVVARNIRVITNSDSKPYDGSPLKNAGYTTYLNGDESKFGLVEGDELVLVGDPAEITNVGSVPNLCAYRVPNDNYVLVEPVICGTLTVTQCHINIELNDVTATYGDVISYPAGENNFKNFASCGLVAGENAEIFVIFTGIEEGCYANVDSYEIIADESKTKINGVQDTSNYAISYVSSTLTVTSREITVKTEGDSQVYNAEPLSSPSASVSVGSVAEGQEIYFIEKFTVTEVADSAYDSTEFFVQYKDSEIDVSANYTISYDYGYLEITKRPISVTTADDSKIYDGEPLSNIGFTTTYYQNAAKEGLLNDDKLAVVFTAEITNVGSIPNACEYLPTNNYEIKEVITGTLEVTQRRIIVTTNGDSKVYDGEPLTCAGYTTKFYKEVSGDTYGNTFGLAKGDSLTLIGELKSITDVGTLKNENRYTASDNYLIEGYGEDGVLEITQRRITVVTDGASRAYTGEALTCTTYTTHYYGNAKKEGLIGDDELTLAGDPAEITNVGTTDNVCVFEVPNDNYAIASYSYGTLEVTAAPMTVVLFGELDDVYYGDLIHYPQGKGNFENKETCGLVNGEEMEVGVYFLNENKVKCTQKNAGLYYVTLDKTTTKVYDKEGNLIDGGIDNYDIAAVEYVQAEILPFTVSFAVEDKTITYGEANIIDYSFTPYTAPYGEEIELAFQFTQNGYIYLYPEHQGEYTISLYEEGSKVYAENGKEVKDGINNYALAESTLDRILKINPKPITVQLRRDITAEYGETYEYAVEAGNYEGNPGLEHGDTLTVVPDMPLSEDLPDKGTYDITAVEADTLINGVKDTSDYIITYIKGTLEITQRTIIVITASERRVYNGDPLINENYTTRHWSSQNKAGLIGDDELTLVGDPAEITDVGSIPNACSFAAPNDNYRILRTETGTLEVYVRRIVIASASGEWPYDGEYHSLPSMDEDESYYLNEDGEKEPALVKDHKFIAGDYPLIKDVGTIPNVCYNNEILDGDDNPVKEGNYEIDSESSGSLTVTPRYITVKNLGATKPYDGTPLTQADKKTYLYIKDKLIYGEGDEEGLVKGDDLILNDSLVSVTNVWEGVVYNTNRYSSPIGEYGNANYVIHSYNDLDLVITAKQITVEIDDVTKDYDAACYLVPDSVNNYKNFETCELVDGEQLKIAIKYEYEDGTAIENPAETRFNAGSYTILLDEPNCKVYRGEKEVFRGIQNYEVTCAGATLTVEKLSVTITQNDITAIYGDEIIYNGFETDIELPYFMGVQDTITLSHYYINSDGEIVSGNLRHGTYGVCANENSVEVNGAFADGVTENYHFEYVDGELYISERHVEITISSITKKYGEAFSYATGAGNYDGTPDLAYDDTLEIFVIIDADEKPFVGNYPIVADESKTPLINGVADASDYIFTYVDGELAIEQRPISIRLIRHMADVTYGETYNYPVGINNYENAATCDVAYEEQIEVVAAFYLDGERVLEHKNVGDYEIRIASLNVFDKDGNRILRGGDNYVFDYTPVTLKIIPKEISVVIDDSSYTYGNDAPEVTYTATGLEYEEVLTLSVIYRKDGKEVEAVNADTYEIFADESVTYINGSQRGVGNYDIGYTYATLTIEKRHIKVETNTSSHVYDGTDYSDTFVKSVYSDDESVTGFIDGYQPEVDKDSVPTVKRVSEGSVSNEFGFTVSDNYIVDDIAYGYISVTARPITVYINSYVIVYGEEFDYPAEIANYNDVFNFVDGDTLQIYAEAVVGEGIPDVDDYDIVGDVTKTLVNGENDYSDYDITFEKGTLSVTVRRILITSASASWPYDGQYHSLPSEDPDECYYINLDGKRVQPALAEGHSFVAGEYPSIKNVGKILNTCYGDGSKIVDKDGNTVKEGNYELVEIEGSGTLEITALKIKIATGDATYVYDGENHYCEDGWVVVDAEKGFVELAPGEYIELSYKYPVKTVAQTKAENNRSTFKVYTGTGADKIETTKNYNIIYQRGQITINLREIEVITATAEKVYDGTPLNNITYTTRLASDPEEAGLALRTETLKVLTSVSITDVGSIENDCTFDVPANYKLVNVIKGTLTVTQRHITVVTNSKTQPYDGSEIYDTGYTTYLTANKNEDGLKGDDTLTLDEDSIVKFSEVDERDNTLVLTLNSDNYYIDETVYGKLIITPRYLVVYTNDAEKPYDGSALKDSGYKAYIAGTTEEGLLDGETLEVITEASLTEVGTKDNNCTYGVPNGNYEIQEVIPGTLEVTAVNLTIYLNDVQDVYYGETLSYEANEEGKTYARVEGLVDGETLMVAVYFTDEDGAVCEAPKDAGTYNVILDLESTAVTGTENGLGNYIPSQGETKTAKIERLALSVILTEEVSYEYDGTAHGYNGESFEFAEGFATRYEETLTVGVKYYDEEGNLLSEAPKNAGSYKIAVDTENCFIGETDASKNYIISETEESEMLDYIITPAKFSVTLSDAEGYYDGEEYDFEEKGDFSVTGLFGTDKIECNLTFTKDGRECESHKNAGDYTVELDIENITFASGLASNYEFDGTVGSFTCTLKVKPRPIHVTVKDRAIEYTEEISADDESYEAECTIGGEAFVGDDEKNADAVFYYGTAMDTNPPTTIGKHTVSVKFLREEVISNYDVTMVQGYLDIVGRRVRVIPYYTGGANEYNGLTIDVDGYVEAEQMGFTHFHDVDDAAEGDEYGFSDEDYNNLTVIYEFKEYTTGVTYTNGEYPKDAGNYVLTVNISGYDTDKYKVACEQAVDFVVISQKNLDVISVGSIEKVYDKQAPETYPEIECDGIVEADVGNVEVVPAYFTEGTETQITAYNAGTYDIGIKVMNSDGSESHNYNIVYYSNSKGKLTITPVTLYIKPASKKALYNGENLALSPYDYLFVDGVGGEHSGLIEGDILQITPSAALDPSKPSIPVSIVDVSVTDAVTGEDMSDNYKIYYNYDKTIMGSGYNSGDFKGTLEYILRTVYFNQIVPEGQGVFPYDGAYKTVTGDTLYEIVEVEGADGLFTTDRIVVSSTRIGPQVGQYYDWLKLKVYDKNNKDVSRVYDLRLLNGADSFITIGTLDIELKIDSSLTNEMLESGEAFYTSEFDGRSALNTGFYELTGIMSGHSYEVIAIKSGGVWNFAVVIYELKSSGSRSDKSDCYVLEVNKPDDLDVVCGIVECHSLSTIKSDITLTLKASYEQLENGEGFVTTYDNRKALNSSQYEISGLLEGHTSEVVVLCSGGKLTLAVLVFEPKYTSGVMSGRSDRSYFYNLISELPADFGGDINILLTASLMEVKQDITLEISADTESILNGSALEKTFDNRLALSEGGFTVDGLMTGHSVQVIAMKSGGKVVLAVLVFEPKLTGGELSGRSDRSYLYNLILGGLPEDFDGEVRLVSSLNEILTDITVNLSSDITAENLAQGIGVTPSSIDSRLTLKENMFTVEESFGESPLLTGHSVEVVVEDVGDGSYNLYVVVFQLSSTGKRSDRSYLYNYVYGAPVESINVIYKSASSLGNAGLN